MSDGNAVNDAFARYREIMAPVYKAHGIENTVNHDSLFHVIGQNTKRFSIQIANAKAVLNGMGHGVDIGI